MKLNKVFLGMALASTMVAGAQAAVDKGHGEITFKGSVIEAACSLDAKSEKQTIQLGSISKKHLSTAGAKSTPVDFDIQLHDCDTATAKNAVVTFNGIAGEAAGALDGAFAVTGQAAGGVGVAITDMGGRAVKPNVAASKMALNDGDNTLRFQAYVQGSSDTTKIATGAFQAVTNFMMDYQ